MRQMLQLVGVVSVALVVWMVGPVLACDVPYLLKIEMVQNQHQGVYASIDVTLEKIDSTKGLTSFDLLISYDQAALSFLKTDPGNQVDSCGWDYFTFQGMPDGLVRIIAIADDEGNGNICQAAPFGVGTVPGTLCQLKFLVSNDRMLNCSFASIDWYWQDCESNVLTSRAVGEMIISNAVFDSDSTGIWNITDSSAASFPTPSGAIAGCPEPFGGSWWRGADFVNGGVQIICSYEIDHCGDINLNALAYDPGDYVMYSRYFLIDTAAFGSHVVGSINASDVNHDGQVLQVADLVFLGRVTVGDTFPLAHDDSTFNDSAATATFVLNSFTLSVEYDGGTGATYDDELGCVWLMVDRNVVASRLQPGIRVENSYDGTNTRVLLYADSMRPAHIVNGPMLLITPVSIADEDFEIVDLQASDPFGLFVETGLQIATDVGESPESELPSDFVLAQNRPNPFNPETQIEFVIPTAASPTFEVFDVMGRLVKRVPLGYLESGRHMVVWRGDDASGHSVASGIYFYRLTAGEYQATRKAVLLK